MQRQPVIAVVDDDEAMRQTTKDLLESAGYVATTFASAESLLCADVLDRIACVTSDIRMPGMSGLELHELLRASAETIPFIFITAYADERMRAQTTRAQAICCLAKPFAAEELLECLRTALQPRSNGTP